MDGLGPEKVDYYESQRKGESIHSPETCLPGSGWEFHETGAAVIPVGGASSMKVNRAFMVINRLLIELT
jgi:EpsI family protein